MMKKIDCGMVFSGHDSKAQASDLFHESVGQDVYGNKNLFKQTPVKSNRDHSKNSLPWKCWESVNPY